MRVERTVSGGVLLLAVVAASACRGVSDTPPVQQGGGPALPPAAAVGGPQVQPGGVSPGIHPSVVLGDLSNPYAGDASTAAQGRQFFVWYNCSGCHGGRAGGGMGPNLRDSSFRKYGNSDTQLYSTIAEGRPAGMPAWGAKLPKDQIWKLITYIRTLGTPQEPDRVTAPQPGE